MKERQERLGEPRSREMSMRPHDPALHCLMGVLLDALGYSDVAEKWLFSALNEDPDYRPAHAALADFYRRHQREPEQVAEQRRLARGARAPTPTRAGKEAVGQPDKTPTNPKRERGELFPSLCARVRGEGRYPQVSAFSHLFLDALSTRELLSIRSENSAAACSVRRLTCGSSHGTGRGVRWIRSSSSHPEVSHAVRPHPPGAAAASR